MTINTDGGGSNVPINLDLGTVDSSKAETKAKSLEGRFESAITKAESGDLSELSSTLSLLTTPPPGNLPKAGDFFAGDNYLTVLFDVMLTVSALVKENKQMEANLAIEGLKYYLSSVDDLKGLIRQMANEKRTAMIFQIGVTALSMTATIGMAGWSGSKNAAAKEKIDKEYATPSDQPGDADVSVKKANIDTPDTPTMRQDATDIETGKSPNEMEVEIGEGRPVNDKDVDADAEIKQQDTDADETAMRQDRTDEADLEAAELRQDDVELDVKKEEVGGDGTKTDKDIEKEAHDLQRKKNEAYRQEASMNSERLQFARELVRQGSDIANKVIDIFILEIDTKKQLGEITEQSVQKLAEKKWTEAERSASTWDEMQTSWIRLFESALQKHHTSWDGQA